MSELKTAGKLQAAVAPGLPLVPRWAHCRCPKLAATTTLEKFWRASNKFSSAAYFSFGDWMAYSGKVGRTNQTRLVSLTYLCFPNHCNLDDSRRIRTTPVNEILKPGIALTILLREVFIILLRHIYNLPSRPSSLAECKVIASQVPGNLHMALVPISVGHGCSPARMNFYITPWRWKFVNSELLYWLCSESSSLFCWVQCNCISGARKTFLWHWSHVCGPIIPACAYVYLGAKAGKQKKSVQETLWVSYPNHPQGILWQISGSTDYEASSWLMNFIETSADK